MRNFVKRAAVALAVMVAGIVGISSPAQAANYGGYVNLGSNYCIDSDANGDVYTLECNSGYYQDWDIQNIATDLYYLKNRQTGRCLDANASGRVYAIACNGGEYQRWYRTRVSSAGYGWWQNNKTKLCLRGSPYVGRQAVVAEACNTSIEGQKWAKV
ncbi:hypothetical protein Acy02nite_91040 [Actinoplanes cyaneus]|uniref:Ricin B lectin domain-containing protein n=1 Tax=Actinoplanes cyaneus TaxID=52696 RepID=A0A919ITQ9_9ACTN|nr:ricin-type beta-trefoil lectin domain protein [Actinoplanes cyaneus]MCW2144547.1 Ricin-type beta-trefoil lectin domain-containing protein [Actinoplanes cyaneus]GID71223.1 hypothetical protein Acy02nite_91040 [Actinoplanes cyaneus]